MRKSAGLWAVLCCAVLVAVGCGSSGKAATGTTQATSATTAATGATGGSGGTSAAGGSKAPLVFGVTGQFNGAGGAYSMPAVQTWQAWQKWINAKGGINGHPVKVIVDDSQGSVAQDLTDVQTLVKSQGAIALANYGTDITPIAAYAQSKGVPVIGGLQSQPQWNTNPYLFPVGTGLSGSVWGAVQVAKNAGASKLGVVICVESPECETIGIQIAALSKSEGIPSNVQRGSLSAPDYTAQCLQLRSFGAKVVVLEFDPNSITRFAQSCSRQGYTPTYEIPPSNGLLQVPQLQNSIAYQGTFPWFLTSGSPALDDYGQALQQYAPSLLGAAGSTSQTIAWESAQLFELAAAHVGDKPTSQDILNGLWAIKNNTLGGLAPGGMAFTFTQNQATPDKYCVYQIAIKSGKWTAPQGLTPTCK